MKVFSEIVYMNVSWWLILGITIYLLHRSRDRRPQALQRREPGWTCRPRAPRGGPPCRPGSLSRSRWRSPSLTSPRRSCLGAHRSESRTCSAKGWKARRFAPSAASWRADLDRPRACFSCADWEGSLGTERFLSFYPCYGICHPCSKSLCGYRGSVGRSAVRKYVNYESLLQ